MMELGPALPHPTVWSQVSSFDIFIKLIKFRMEIQFLAWMRAMILNEI